MQVRAAFFARLALYATALFVVATVQLPAPTGHAAVSALRAAEPGAIDPVRLVIAGILLAGVIIEVLHRRAVWH